MMSTATLSRWLLRRMPGAERLELVHHGASEEPRVASSWDLQGVSGRDAIEDLARDVLSVAQDEAELAEVRCSFVIQLVRGDGADVRVHASQALRCEPNASRAAGDDIAEDGNRDGVLRMVMQQNRDLLKDSREAAKLQRQVYSEIISDVRAYNAELRTENTTLKAENAALRANVSDEDQEVIAEIVEADRKRGEFTQKVLTDGFELVKSVASVVLADHINGAAGEASTGGAQTPPSTPQDLQ